MKSSKRIWAVYFGGFFLAIHYATVAYINSSLLKQFAGDQTVSILYIIGSILSVATLSLAPFFLRRFGNIATLLFFIVIESFAVFGLGSSELGILVFLLFLLHQAAESILNFSLDVSLEHEIKNESVTGGSRGTFLTIQNIAWVLSPLALSFLVNQNDFGSVYFLSGAALIPLFFIGATILSRTKNSNGKTSHILQTIKLLPKHRDQFKILTAQFILQFYFSWMVIYLPLMLSQEIGFEWKSIGLILTIMLLPYLLFEIPTGLLADKKYGEREILTAGFLTIIIATIVIPLIDLPIFWLWAGVLFATRIGASLVEIASESYFFKHVKERDTGLISLFRITRPLSSIMAPIIALPIIHLTSYSTSFLFLAIFTSLGLIFIPKKDTK